MPAAPAPALALFTATINFVELRLQVTCLAPVAIAFTAIVVMRITAITTAGVTPLKRQHRGHPIRIQKEFSLQLLRRCTGRLAWHDGGGAMGRNCSGSPILSALQRPATYFGCAALATRLAKLHIQHAGQ